MSSLLLPSSFGGSPSWVASSTWASMSAMSASSSLFLTLYTSSSCFLHTEPKEPEVPNGSIVVRASAFGHKYPQGHFQLSTLGTSQGLSDSFRVYFDV